MKIVEEIRQEEKAHLYAELGQKRETVRERLRKLPEYVKEARYYDQNSEKSGKIKES